MSTIRIDGREIFFSAIESVKACENTVEIITKSGREYVKECGDKDTIVIVENIIKNIAIYESI